MNVGDRLRHTGGSEWEITEVNPPYYRVECMVVGRGADTPGEIRRLYEDELGDFTVVEGERGAEEAAEAPDIAPEPPAAGCRNTDSPSLAPGDAECCHRCGSDNPPWSAASPLWNAVMRGGSINGKPLYGDMVCATCFTELAEAMGIASRFRLTAEVVNVELETVTPSGRVWDPERFLYVEPEATNRG